MTVWRFSPMATAPVQALEAGAASSAATTQRSLRKLLAISPRFGTPITATTRRISTASAPDLQHPPPEPTSVES